MAVRTTAERIVKLKTIRDGYEDILGEMASSPRVSYDVDGQKFDFNQYQKILLDAISGLDKQIAYLETLSASGGMTLTQIFTGT